MTKIIAKKNMDTGIDTKASYRLATSSEKIGSIIFTRITGTNFVLVKVIDPADKRKRYQFMYELYSDIETFQTSFVKHYASKGGFPQFLDDQGRGYLFPHEFSN